MSCVILGRGESIKRLKEFNKDVDYVIIINELWLVFKKDDENALILKNFLKNKKIIIIASSLGVDTFKQEKKIYENFIKSYNIIGKFNTIFKNKNSWRHSTCLWNGFDYFPEKYNEFAKNTFLKTNIMSSIHFGFVYSLQHLNSTEINIFGLDFYEKPHISLINKTLWTNEQKNNLRVSCLKFFNMFKNINWHIYSFANVDEFKNNHIFVH
jgi:hypothetical protein